FPLLEHLPADDLDVLVVDVDALGLVDGLDFAHQVLLDAANALQVQHLLRIERTFRQSVARADVLARLHFQEATIRHQVALPKTDSSNPLVPDLLTDLVRDLLTRADDHLAAAVQDILGRRLAVDFFAALQGGLRVDHDPLEACALDLGDG